MCGASVLLPQLTGGKDAQKQLSGLHTLLTREWETAQELPQMVPVRLLVVCRDEIALNYDGVFFGRGA